MGSDEKQSFTVKDRRLFTPEGERREEPAERAAVETPPPAAEAAAPAPAPTPLAGGEADAPVRFTEFVTGLAAQCSLLLGMYPQAGNEPASPDLDGARHVISILEMLREKTQGGLTAEESDTLESILYQLRMAYVTLAGRGRA